jgi:hypothetical protein
VKSALSMNSMTQNNYSEIRFFTNVIQDPIESGASLVANQAVCLSHAERLVLGEPRYRVA